MKKTQDNLNGDEAIISYELASELGTIEKLYPKYGFIKCLNKENQDKRLFFHYSSIKSHFCDLQIGDNVFFQRGISKGKPLATDIVVQSHVEIIEGIIIKMPRKGEKGSISYKYNEECFYLPFSKDDLYEDVKLKAKDEVTFEKSEQDGSLSAVNIRKKYNKPIKVQGIVTSVKDKFGFIDRSDMVKEIYFNLSASPDGVIMQPGIELEFNVKHLRNGKEEAVNLRVLEKGTVQFVDVFDNSIYGTLLRSPDCKRVNNSDPLAGNISYVCGNECKVMQIPFGEKDKKYQYSLHPGDIVAFKIAVDRRDQLQRACQVELCLNSFPSRKETRHMGVVKMFDGSAGLIEPDLSAIGDEDMLVAFKAKEWLSANVPLTKFAMVSYTPLQVSRTVGGYQKLTTTALRIMLSKEGEKMTHLKLYPAGSLRGTIKTAAHTPDDLGIIICQLPSSSTKPIAYTSDDVINCRPRVGDEVSFGCLDRTTSQYLPPAAFNIELCAPSAANNSSFSRHLPDSHRSSESRKLRSRTLPDDKITPPILDHSAMSQSISKSLRGWIVISKEFFGFIETADHSALYKFGPTTIKKSKLQSELKVGSAIEFIPVPSCGVRPRRIVDVLLRLLPDPLTNETIVETKRVGLIVRPLLISENTDKDNQYVGLVEDSDNDCQYSYSMKSLVSFRTKLSPGDRVLFDVAQMGQDVTRRLATSVVLLRQSGRVSSLKKPMVCVERQFDEDEGDNGLPVSFEIDTDRPDIGADAKGLNIDDVVQIDLDIHKESRNLSVISIKLLKSAEISARKVFKSLSDDNIPRILHHRGPRIPEGESIGFTEQLRRLPRLQC